MVQIDPTIEDDILTTGTNFSLICNVYGTAKLRPELSFEWTYYNNGTDLEVVKTNSNELGFSPLKLSDAGAYTCRVSINSSLLNSNLTISSTLPHPVKVFGKLVYMLISLLCPYNSLYLNTAPFPIVTAIQPLQALFAGSSPNFTCVAEFDDTVDVPLVVNIAAFADMQNIETDYSVQVESYRRYTKKFTINSLQPNVAFSCVVNPPYSESTLNILMQNNNITPVAYSFVNISVSK